MAERVQKSLESTLPELEELEKAGIFNKEEIRAIVKKRRRLEYRLLRRPARIADYLRAIQYEVNLDLLRKHRIKSHGVDSKASDAKHSITARLHTLFQRAVKKFKGNIRLWLQYIEFCKRVKHHHTLSKLYGKVLALHPRNSGLWIMAAKYQLEEENNPAAARTLLQRAIRINNQCKQLWLEYFRMELLHVDQVVKRHNVLTGPDDEEVASNDDFITNKTAVIVYKAAVAAIPGDIQFHLSFLPILKLFANTEDLQEQIWTNIQGDFPNDPVMWDVLARRPWDEVDTALLSEDHMMQLEKTSYRVYKEAVTKLPSADMYEKMIGWCLERLQQQRVESSKQPMVLQRLLDALQLATDNNCMNLNTYKIYVTLLLDVGKTTQALQVAEVALCQHPECLELWEIRLSSPMATKEEKKKWMESALKRAANESVLLDLWQLYLKWSIADQQDSSVIMELFERAMDCMMGHAKSELLLNYIDWLLVAMGIDHVRNQYPRIVNDKPVALNVCYKCIDIEENQDSADMSRIHQLYESALSDHGHHDIRLWLRYMKYEATTVGGDLSNVGKLYWRALRTLSPDLVSDFITEHTLQQNSL